MAGIALPAAVWPLPEDEALAVADGLPAVESRPEGLGVDGLPLRPADEEELEGEALLELELELELALELELLCDDGDGMDAEGEDDEDELEGMEGMELCDDCC